MLMTPERQYAETNKASIAKIVLDASKEQREIGNEFDARSYIINYLTDIREGNIDIHQGVDTTLHIHLENNKRRYIEPPKGINIESYIDMLVGKTYTSKEQEVFVRKYRFEKVQHIQKVMDNYGVSVAKEQAYRDIKGLKRVISKDLQSSTMTLNGKLIEDDVRRLHRMKYLLQTQQEDFKANNIKYKDNIDGTINSHILLSLPLKNGKSENYVITPSKIINHSQRKVLYEREFASSTLKEFKDSVISLGDTVEVDALKLFANYMGTSLDLRKTVIDNKGKKY